MDRGIEKAVRLLLANGIETFESCEGGKGTTRIPNQRSDSTARRKLAGAPWEYVSLTDSQSLLCGAFGTSWTPTNLVARIGR